jgi:serine/threonine protein kinase
MLSPCPTDFEICRYLAKELEPADLVRIKHHIELCSSCAARLALDGQSRKDGTSGPKASDEADTIAGHGRAVDFNVAPSSFQSQPAHPAVAPSITVEGYRVIREIARGGMGVIYEAVQLKLNRRVALKVLPSIGSGSNDQAISRFRHEATAAAKLHHTHIVPIYDFGQSGHTYYYAMELVEGQPLTEMIRRFSAGNAPSAASATLVDMVRGVEPGSAVRDDSSTDSTSSSMSGFSSHSSSRGRVYFRHVAHWMANAADALHYAHSHDIIHRDIKPGNLMLCTDGRIMILDFGLAKSLSDVSVTTTGALVGTLRYMSPEQAMAKRMKVDHRTDIYSLGATMYELLTFQPAFRGSDEKETLGLIITKDATPPRKIVPEVPKEMETICLKTLEKDPGARYATAKDLADDLRRFIQDLPIVAKPVGPIGRAIKFARRRRAVSIAVFAILLLAVASVLAIRANRHARESDLAARETAREAKRLRLDGLIREGVDLRARKEWEAADSTFMGILKEDPTNYRAIMNLVAVRKDRYGDRIPEDVLDECNVLLDRAVQADPIRSETWNAKGVFLRMRGRLEEAIAAHKKSLELDPKAAGAYANWVNLGSVYAKKGDLESAAASLQRSVGLPQGKADTMAWHNLAAVQHQLGQPGALSTIERALAIRSGEPALMVLKARIHLSGTTKQDWKQALHAAITAEGLCGSKHKNARISRILSLAELRNEQWEEARHDAQRALDAGDQPSWPHLILAIIDARAGQAGSAQGHLDAAKAARPAAFSTEGRLALIEQGLLWIDSAAELESLTAEAQRLLAGRS